MRRSPSGLIGWVPIPFHTFYPDCFSHKASRTAPGDMGREFMRTPMALWIALATAGTGGIVETYPTPLTPVGWPGFGTSTSWVSIIGRSMLSGMR